MFGYSTSFCPMFPQFGFGLFRLEWTHTHWLLTITAFSLEIHKAFWTFAAEICSQLIQTSYSESTKWHKITNIGVMYVSCLDDTVMVPAMYYRSTVYVYCLLFILQCIYHLFITILVVYISTNISLGPTCSNHEKIIRLT